MLPDAVIIIMVGPNELNDIFNEKALNIQTDQYLSTRQLNNNTRESKMLKIDTLDPIVKKYRSDAILYEKRRIEEQLEKHGVVINDFISSLIDEKIAAKNPNTLDIRADYEIKYIDHLIDNVDYDYTGEYIEENEGFKISRFFRPHYLFTRNRQALKRFYPNDKSQKWRHYDFKHHYGGRTRRLKKGK